MPVLMPDIPRTILSFWLSHHGLELVLSDEHRVADLLPLEQALFDPAADRPWRASVGLSHLGDAEPRPQSRRRRWRGTFRLCQPEPFRGGGLSRPHRSGLHADARRSGSSPGVPRRVPRNRRSPDDWRRQGSPRATATRRNLIQAAEAAFITASRRMVRNFRARRAEKSTR